MTIDELEFIAGLTFTDAQLEALASASVHQGPTQRRCLYFKTGSGKTYTSLGMVRLWGHRAAVVIAPPSTHAAWEAAGDRFGIDVLCMSHAKFRQAGTKLKRDVPVIADEFHLFGGHSGKGWKKFDGLARGLQAPIVLASATPNYNDAERVYCIQHVLDPHSCKGGYIQFLYTHCVTEENPFGREPKVLGFQRYKDAAEYLADLPNVDYLPDDLVYQIEDLGYTTPVPWAYEVFGYDEREHRITASQMEDRHKRINLALLDKHGLIHSHVFEMVLDLIEESPKPVLVYANHATVANALSGSLSLAKKPHEVVTGDTSKRRKEEIVREFNRGLHKVLVGTASLATGTDGLDKVCDRLIILDDTDDDSLRRQLVGRIMPRGLDTDASSKQVIRLLQV